MARKFPRLHNVPGFRVSALKAGIKASGNLDLGLILAAEPATATALFTQNRVCAAPVKHSRKALQKSGGKARAILANAGNANCCTGPRGRQDALDCAELVARLSGCKPHEVLLASTGIIGEHLPMKNVIPAIEEAHIILNSRKVADKKFADAIRTLDTHAKERGVRFNISGKEVTIAAAAKGIGMCAPNMATVLIFILTDAVLTHATQKRILEEVASATFNRVSVDSDTSTNDSCFLLSSGKAGNTPIKSATSVAGKAFASALHGVCYDLARMLAADGEGATRYMQVNVTGARSEAKAGTVARAICESPLVKTAVCGADPNWGRILMAAGKCGVALKEDNCTVKINSHILFKDGAPAQFKPGLVSKAMKRKEVFIELDLGMGKSSAEMFGCDLTHGYVTINADYHT